MFVQNFIKLSAAVHELSCIQRRKTLTNTMQSVATVRTVINTMEIGSVQFENKADMFHLM